MASVHLPHHRTHLLSRCTVLHWGATLIVFNHVSDHDGRCGPFGPLSQHRLHDPCAHALTCFVHVAALGCFSAVSKGLASTYAGIAWRQ